jgi:hypothetical protein
MAASLCGFKSGLDVGVVLYKLLQIDWSTVLQSSVEKGQKFVFDVLD